MINLYDILKENLIIESQESKSQAKAKKLAIKHGMNSEEAEDFVRLKLRNDITNLRHSNTAKFTLGCARLFFDGELTDAKSISTLNNIIELIANKHIDKFDQNLNGLSLNELINQFNGELEEIEQQNREEVNSKEYTNNGYEIIPINSFEEAQEYNKYLYNESPWCITYMESMWDNYTKDGYNQVYFCLKDGFENVEPHPIGRPKDEYGLSMISVIVDEDGKLEYSTTRWNHANRANGDHDFSVQEISDIVGVNFYETFKPNEDESRRGLTIEEYYEEVTENQVYINRFGDIDIFFSQDLEPYHGEKLKIANHEDFEFGIYSTNEWGENILIDGFNYAAVEESVVESNSEFYSIVKDRENDLYLIYNNFSDSTDYDSVRIDDYLKLADDDILVAYSKKELFIIKNEEGVVYGNEEDNITNFYAVLEDKGNFLQIVNNYGDFTLINADDGKVIIEKETPLNGETFEIDENGNIPCEDGTYTIDGDLIQGVGKQFHISKKLDNGFAYVTNKDDEKNIYNIKEKKLVYDISFIEISCLNFDNRYNDIPELTSLVNYKGKYNVVTSNNGKTNFIFKEGFDYILPYSVESHIIFRIVKNGKYNVSGIDGNLMFKEWKDDVVTINRDYLSFYKAEREWAYFNNDADGVNKIYVIFDVIDKKILTPKLKRISQIDRNAFSNNEFLIAEFMNGKKAIISKEEHYTINKNFIFNDISNYNFGILLITYNNGKKGLFSLYEKTLITDKKYNNIRDLGSDRYSANGYKIIYADNGGNNGDLYVGKRDYVHNKFDFYKALSNLNNVRIGNNFNNIQRPDYIQGEPYMMFNLNNNEFVIFKGMEIMKLNDEYGMDYSLADEDIQNKLMQYNEKVAQYTNENIKRIFFKKYNLIENIIKNNFIR